MAVTDVALTGSFLSEVAWAKDTIIKIFEHKIRSRAIGIREDTKQPDDLFLSFMKRDLAFASYVRRPDLSVGTADAYLQNIGTLDNYIERLRQQEIKSVNSTINEVLALKAQGWSIGLSWPGGQPDDFARYFAARDLLIACYVQGAVSVGDSGAYDRNVATLNAYILQIGAATIR
jgi:hypothetical protein